MFRVKLVLLFLTVLLSASQISANTLINGIGAFSEFQEKVMLLKLETETPSADVQSLMMADVSKRFSIRIIKDRSPRLWSMIWVQNLAINNTSEKLLAEGDDLIHMTSAIKGMLRPGDLIEFDRLAFDDTRMSVNGIEIAQYSTPDFFEFLLTAWIGPIPPSSSLKSQLMGMTESDDLRQEFNSWYIGEEAIARASDWIIKPELESPTESDRQSEQEEPLALDKVTEEPEVVELQQTDIQVADEVIEPELEVKVTEEPEVVELQQEDILVEDEIMEPEQETKEDVVEQLALVDEPEDEAEQEFALSVESLLAIQKYQKSIVDKVSGNVRYPKRALEREIEGALRVSISVSADGSLNNMAISESSDYQPFDKALEKAIKDAEPFDPIPSDVIAAPMNLEIPFAFLIQG